jgi:hypothetical protein
MKNTAPLSTNPKDSIGRSKPSPSLLPSALVLNVAQVMRLGAQKYGPFNWRVEKVSLTVYIDAAMRHLLQFIDGEDCDPESGAPHTAHVAACMGILLDAAATGNLLDDRPTKGAASELIKRFTEANKSKAEADKANAEANKPFPRFFYTASGSHSYYTIIRVSVTPETGGTYFLGGSGWSSSNWTLKDMLYESTQTEITETEAWAKGLPSVKDWPDWLKEDGELPGKSDETIRITETPLND